MAIFTAAAVQMRSGTEIARNVRDMEEMVREAASRGATYVQTPEMTGGLVRDKDARAAAFTTEDRDPVAAAAAALAAELGIFLHVGSTAIVRADGKLANRAFLFGPDGRRLASYDKIHMFDVDLDNGESWRESSAYEAGREAVVAYLPIARLGFAICYDLRFPQLFRAEALAGAELISVPGRLHPPDRRGALARAAARPRHRERRLRRSPPRKGGVHEDGRETFGHSLIVDPWGRILAEADHAEPGVIVAEIDTAAVAAARAKIPNLKNAREFSVRSVEASGPAGLRGAAS